MKRLLLFIAMVAITALAHGQRIKKHNASGVHKSLAIKGSLTYPKDSIYFLSGVNEPIMILMNNGDIFYKGRKLVTDTAIVNGLRELVAAGRREK